jgi:hypothetical protein
LRPIEQKGAALAALFCFDAAEPRDSAGEATLATRNMGNNFSPKSPSTRGSRRKITNVAFQTFSFPSRMHRDFPQKVKSRWHAGSRFWLPAQWLRR